MTKRHVLPRRSWLRITLNALFLALRCVRAMVFDLENYNLELGSNVLVS